MRWIRIFFGDTRRKGNAKVAYNLTASFSVALAKCICLWNVDLQYPKKSVRYLFQRVVFLETSLVQMLTDFIII